LNSESINKLGENQLLNNVKLALFYFNLAIKKDSKCQRAYINRSHIHKIRKEFDLALKDLNTAISIKRRPDIILKRGEVYLALNNINEALNDFSESVKLKNNIGRAYYLMAISHARLNNFEKALNFIDLSINLNYHKARKYKESNTELLYWQREFENRKNNLIAKKIEKYIGVKIFKSNDLVNLYDSFRQLGSKKESETTGDFISRLKKHTNSKYAFKVYFNLYGNYNADIETLHVPILSNYSKRINIGTYSNPDNFYTGVNAFGVQRLVTSSSSKSYGLLISNEEQIKKKLKFYDNDFCITEKLINKEVSKYRTQNELVIVGYPELKKNQFRKNVSLISYDHYIKKPTLNDPEDRESEYHDINFKITDIIVYDIKNGNVRKHIKI
jgi:tetratricopeptide (TPR) repeat protein